MSGNNCKYQYKAAISYQKYKYLLLFMYSYVYKFLNLQHTVIYLCFTIVNSFSVAIQGVNNPREMTTSNT